jgi:uncharacterized protein
VTTYLLDVNVLLAFHDRWHVNHQLVRPWFIREGQRSWATCPLTENGFVRIASQPAYPNPTGGLQTLVALVRSFRGLSGHNFWADDISIVDALDPFALITHSHLTDVYLLALAVKNGGKLATLDDRLPADAVRGGPQAIEVLRP